MNDTGFGTEKDLGHIRQLEELTLSTSPSIHQRNYDGWVLRASNTDTRRANSVTALHPSTLDLDQKIAFCEGWYALHGQRAVFRLTSELAPDGLDTLLDQRSYGREVETLVMTLPVADDGLTTLANLPKSLRIVERTTAEGIADAHRLKGGTVEMVAQDLKRQSVWRGPQKFLALMTPAGIMSCGMARLEDGHVGIFNMRTASAERGRGYAGMLVAHLIKWGRAEGAHTAFLQVDRENTAAVTIYRRLGFVPQYLYWHRLQALPATTFPA
jgi:N-acetylglutamate synthase